MDPIESPVAALEVGVVMSADPDPEVAKAKAREEADVKRWMERLKQTRKYDEPAREQYVRDRRYARGDTGAEVAANLVGTYIDILEAFLYARDPDFDIRPGPTVRPPTLDALRDAVEDDINQSPEVRQAGMAALQQAVAQGADQMQAAGAAKQAADAAAEAMIQQQVDALRKQYAKRQREVKAFAETAEVIGQKLWSDGQLKKRGRPWVRSALTVAVGVIKASWQERTAPSPETVTAINDLQANIKRLQMLAEKADDPDCPDDDAALAELQRQLAALQGQVEQVVSRGFAIDCVAAEDFDVAPGYTIANHCDAPWNAQRIPMRYDDAMAEFDLDKETMRQAKQYTARKPVMVKNDAALMDGDVDPKEADAYISTSGGNTQGQQDDGGKWVMVREIWDRDSNTVLTAIDGIKRWVKEGWNPPATTRFYPFFLFTTGELDGQRHPQSLPSRSAKLVDEYNRIGSAEAEHRRRVKPKTVFNAGLMSPKDAKKLQDGVSVEMVAINPTQPNTPVGNIVQVVTYPRMDPGLYNRQPIIGELERIWGVQEALSGAVNVAKTATESEIQQSGFQARSGSRRDALESSMTELAQYTVEVARVYVSNEDAVAIAGPDAFWPPYEGPDDLARMLTIDIRAGSSGKPNTSAERQAWATQLPILQNGIVQIGQLRQSSPADIADALERLLQITAERSGDRIDIDQLVPQAGPQPVMPAPMPGQQPSGATPAGGPLPAVQPPHGGDPAIDPLQQEQTA